MGTVAVVSTGVFLIVLVAILVLGFGLVAIVTRRADPPAADWEARLAAVRPEVVRQLHLRQPVRTVRVVRGATGLGLKDAKDVTDAIALQERIDPRGGRRR